MERRLAAILAADVVGYSRLIREDEDGTIAALRIEVLNQVLFVFDNDAEGVDAFRKLEKLKLPTNMRAMLLPDLEEFRAFPSRGPEGVSVSDINGRAAAIECYCEGSSRLKRSPSHC